MDQHQAAGAIDSAVWRARASAEDHEGRPRGASAHGARIEIAEPPRSGSTPAGTLDVEARARVQMVSRPTDASRCCLSVMDYLFLGGDGAVHEDHCLPVLAMKDTRTKMAFQPSRVVQGDAAPAPGSDRFEELEVVWATPRSL